MDLCNQTRRDALACLFALVSALLTHSHLLRNTITSTHILQLTMGYTSPASQAKIVTMIDHGMSQHAVGRELGISHSTAANIYERIKAGQSYYYYAPKCGRPLLLSKANAHYAARKVRTGEIPNAVGVKQQLFPDASVKTIRCALKGTGLQAYRRRRKFYLKAAHASARRKWAREHREWTVDDWKRIVYSDESKFNLHGSDGNRWVWRERGKGFDRRYVDAHEKYGGGSVMVWGCITRFGFGRLVRITGKVDAKKYVAILEDASANQEISHRDTIEQILLESIESYHINVSNLWISCSYV